MCVHVHVGTSQMLLLFFTITIDSQMFDTVTPIRGLDYPQVY